MSRRELSSSDCAGLPSFERQSFANQHWPMAWFVLLLGLMIWFGSFLLTSAGAVLGSHFRYQPNQITVDFNKPYSDIAANFSRENQSLRQKADIAAARDRGAQLDAWRDSFSVLSVDLSNVEALAQTAKERQYIEWQLHRRTGFAALQYEQLDLAKSEFEKNLSLANALGRAEPMIVQSKLDLAWVNVRLLLEYEYRAAILRSIVLPCFSLVAAFLPFLLVVRFLRRRKNDGISDSSEENYSEILWVKLLTASSWCMAIAASWVALRNYAFGVDNIVVSGAVSATIFSIVAMVLGLTLLLRYMPPTRNLTVRAMLIQCGFGGLLLSLKATAIYLALCCALASHPGINQFLFLSNTREALRKDVGVLVKAAEADSRALASNYSRVFRYQIRYLNEVVKPRAITNCSISGNVSQNAVFPQVGALARLKNNAENEFEKSLNLRFSSQNISNRLIEGSSARLSVSSSEPKPVYRENRLAALWLIFELFCIFTLIVYPEALAYIFSLSNEYSALAQKWFERAVRVKAYVLGENHWHIASMRLTFGRILIADRHNGHFDQLGESQIQEAVRIYESACGRHAEETLAAKLVLASFYQKRGNSAEAEKILLEAKQGAGTNLELVPYCTLLNQLASIYLSQDNLARAKSIYREQIELLTKALETHPVSHGFWSMVGSHYKSQAGWQIEATLVLAQVGLAEVFARMRYEGEVEHLINEAVNRMNHYASYLNYYHELTEAYVRAHMAQAQMFLRQNKIDQALKIASDCSQKLEKTGFVSRPFSKELLHLTNELRLQSGLAKTPVPEICSQAFAMEGDLGFSIKYDERRKIELKEGMAIRVRK